MQHRMNEIVKMIRAAGSATVVLRGEPVTIGFQGSAQQGELVMLGGGYYVVNTTDGRKFEIGKGQLVEVAPAPAAVEADAPAAADQEALEALKFPALLALAQQLKVPGRGTARKPELITGILAARHGGAVVVAARPRISLAAAAGQPRPVVPPGKAAYAVVWPTARAGRDTTGRWEVERKVDGGRFGGERFTYVARETTSGRKVGHESPTLRQARQYVQAHVEELERAHNSARAAEAARLAGEPQWAALDALRLQAMGEDARRQRGRERGPRELSGLGKLAQSYREAARVPAPENGVCGCTNPFCQV
jgi:hypothetical protein